MHHWSDDEEGTDSKWVTETIKLGPERSFTKNTGSIAVLTHCSFAVPLDSSDSYYAVLTAETWDESTVLCTLFPREPSKPMKLIWGPTQSVLLMNKGNREMTLVMLTKRTC